jgi:hypothetical protein
MTEREFSLGLAFLWLGFSLVFFLFFCITHVDRDSSPIDGASRTSLRPGLGRAGRLILAALGLSGAWGLATLLGLYRSSDGCVQVFMLGGMLLGVAVSYRIFGWPNIQFKKNPKDKA